MGRAFKSDVQIIQVRTDDHVRGVARFQYWAAAAAPEQAVMLVLAAVPEGWAVCLSDEQVGKIPALQPGEIRLIK